MTVRGNPTSAHAHNTSQPQRAFYAFSSLSLPDTCGHFSRLKQRHCPVFRITSIAPQRCTYQQGTRTATASASSWSRWGSRSPLRTGCTPLHPRCCTCPRHTAGTGCSSTPGDRSNPGHTAHTGPLQRQSTAPRHTPLQCRWLSLGGRHIQRCTRHCRLRSSVQCWRRSGQQGTVCTSRHHPPSTGPLDTAPPSHWWSLRGTRTQPRTAHCKGTLTAHWQSRTGLRHTAHCTGTTAVCLPSRTVPGRSSCRRLTPPQSTGRGHMGKRCW